MTLIHWIAITSDLRSRRSWVWTVEFLCANVKEAHKFGRKKQKTGDSSRQCVGRRNISGQNTYFDRVVRFSWPEGLAGSSYEAEPLV